MEFNQIRLNQSAIPSEDKHQQSCFLITKLKVSITTN